MITSRTDRLIFYPQYCLGCGCSFVSKTRHARCWSCNGTRTVNCFREMYDGISNSN